MSNLPTVTHPSWCDPAHCTRTGAPVSVEHRSTPTAFEAVDAKITTARAVLVTVDGEQEHDLVQLMVEMTGTDSATETLLSAIQARQLAATLLNLADALDGGRS